MNEKTLMHNQGATCPECGKEIVLNWPRAEVLTLKEFRKRVQEMMKAMKEEEG